ncbi:MAG: molybdate ABC transporter substrate-binding protein [Gammaproteobacteria bacterium]|nr:molybdate ABC transporter substrate-binding protein [Gammaproteobacteria bacterium]
MISTASKSPITVSSARIRRLVRCAGILAALVSSAPAMAAQATVAVATNFAAAMKVLAEDFHRASGHEVIVATGSTGKLYAQISHGAPFDVFLAADQDHVRKLERDGSVVKDSRFTYALGALTLWRRDPTPMAGPPQVVLASPAVRHVAIANPRLAPYGKAAQQVLQRLNLWDEVAPRIVIGQNIGETFSMVATGNAEVGFVALSSVFDLQGDAAGSRWDIPQSLYDPIAQDAVLLRHGADNTAAIAFLDFLRSPVAHKIIRGFGYEVMQ